MSGNKDSAQLLNEKDSKANKAKELEYAVKSSSIKSILKLSKSAEEQKKSSSVPYELMKSGRRY